MKHSELLDTLQNLTNKKIKQKELAEALGVDIGVIGKRASRNSEYSLEEIISIYHFFNLTPDSVMLELPEFLRVKPEEKKWYDKIIKNFSSGASKNSEETPDINCVKVVFRPEVSLSAGYGIEVYDEHKEYMCLDERLFYTDRGTKINPNNCEIVTISGNSMSPEYRHGDRVILDKSETHFSDGHIFAFRFNGECFIKEICLVGKRIKAIPLNKEYEPFWIEPEDEVTIFGRIVPRVRL